MSRLAPVSIDAVELRRIRLEFRTPFRTSASAWSGRDVLLVRVIASGERGAVDGWGECVAPTTPTYTAEYTDGAHAVVRDHLLPRLFAADVRDARDVAPALAGVVGHPMATAAIECAVLDAQLRVEGVSLASHLGATATHVAAGATFGLPTSLDDLVAVVRRAVDDGYRRVKIKVAPGVDAEPLARLRREFGDDVALQVDANCAYRPDHAADVDALRALDEFSLLLVEQPFAPDRILDHADLAATMATPVCLDESIVSDSATADVIRVGAASVVNVKWGRVGGVFEAVAIHDRCRDAGIGLWHGGMLETGVGRAVGLAVAALDGFGLPSDLAAADRYWERDVVTTPAVLEPDGTVAVPDGPGIGVDVDEDFLDSVTTHVERVDRPLREP